MRVMSDDPNSKGVHDIDWGSLTLEEQVEELNRLGLIGYTAFIVADLSEGHEVAREITSDTSLVYAKVSESGKLQFIVEDPVDDQDVPIH